jgi:hypothetical protein
MGYRISENSLSGFEDQVPDPFLAEEAASRCKSPCIFDSGVSGNICERMVARQIFWARKHHIQINSSGTEIDMEHPFYGRVQASPESR